MTFRQFIISVTTFAIGNTCFASESVSIENLRRDIVKIDKSILETKAKIKVVKDAVFLPELYFALAEFLVDKSRFSYALKVAENPKHSLEELDFTAEKRPKLEAIQYYDVIIEKFPKLDQRDKAIFFRAHELRELGRFDEMILSYEKLTREYKDSPYWSESQIILGDHYLEVKKNLELAREHYLKVLQRPKGPYWVLAQYKMGWVWINKNEFLKALECFESVLNENKEVDLSQLPEIYKKTDIRREALMAIVWPFSELTAKDHKILAGRTLRVIPYFQALSPDFLSYQRVLPKLGRRLVLKQHFIEATQVFFEALRHSSDTKERIELHQSVYISMKNSQKDWPVQGLVEEAKKTFLKLEEEDEFSPKDSAKVRADLEIFVRDIATRQNRRAKITRTKEDWNWTIQNYLIYLESFPKSKYVNAIHLNLAESYFNSDKKIEAGKEYEYLISSSQQKPRLKGYFESSIESYVQGIRNQSELSKLLLLEARYGLRSVGRLFLKQYPNDPINGDLMFNMAQTYYDERRFPEAVAQFKEYLQRYPSGSKVTQAVQLVLDAHNQREDFKSIISDGKSILANPHVSNAALKGQIREIVQQAEMKVLQSAAGDFSQPEYASNLLKLARKYKGSQLGDQALFEAFVSLKAKKDPRAYSSGEQLLLQHKDSKYALEVVSAMGQMALSSADFRRAAIYFEIFNERFPGQPEAKELLKSAAQMRELMGDFKLAAADYRKLGQNNDVARMDFLASDWPQLLRSAPLAEGMAGIYYEALAQYRINGFSSAKALLNKAAQSGGNSPEEQEMAAHAWYLLASNALDNYKSVRMRPGAETKAIEDKSAMLKDLEQQLNHVIQFGNGRWTIAALYSLGLAYKEFSEFIEAAPTPTSLTAEQRDQFRNALLQKASPYNAQAAKSFQQCLQSAEKFEVLTRFALACHSMGKLKIDESQDLVIRLRAGETSPKETEPLRRILLDSPKDVGILRKLAAVYVKAKDYAMAKLVLNRALEISPNEPSLLSEMGVIHLYQKDYMQAKVWFKKSQNLMARKGLKSLYSQFKFISKAKLIDDSGPLTGLSHPWLK